MSGQRYTGYIFTQPRLIKDTWYDGDTNTYPPSSRVHHRRKIGMYNLL